MSIARARSKGAEQLARALRNDEKPEDVKVSAKCTTPRRSGRALEGAGEGVDTGTAVNVLADKRMVIC